MKKSPALKNRIADNRGSAIITVVIGMLFVIALGFGLMFSAYTGYKIKLAERQDKETFYSAEAVLDEIRANIQTLVSDALSNAYTEILPQHANSDEAQTALRESFEKFLFAPNGNTSLFTNGGYSLETMKNWLAPRPDAEVSLGVNGNFAPVGAGPVVIDPITGISLKDVSVRVTRNGYESNITADLAIKVPAFYVSSAAPATISSYTLVASRALSVNSGKRSISGMVFAGTDGITVSGTSNSLTLSGGDTYCSGPVNVSTSALFSFDAPTNELWVESFAAGLGGAINITGNTYVANDLALEGTRSSATLKGTYFGFGESISNSDKSSAILVNGQNSSLSVSGLSRLSLAGISFVDVLGATNAPNKRVQIPMGESLSVKSNQLAYLVPVACIINYPSNPYAFNNNADAVEPNCSKTAPLWDVNGVQKTLGDYIGTSGSKGSIKTLYKPLDNSDGPYIAYVFISFNKQEYANEYFKDYFAVHPERVGDYLDLYITLDDLPAGSVISSAGNTLYAKDNKLNLRDAVGVITTEAAQSRFDSLVSPFASFVNTPTLAAIPRDTVLTFNNADNKQVAVVSNGKYTYGRNSSEDIRLIITSGDVTIDKDFTGVVLSGGSVILNSNITAVPLDQSILSALSGTYALHQFINDASLANSAYVDDPWSPNKLVVYQNWRKH